MAPGIKRLRAFLMFLCYYHLYGFNKQIYRSDTNKYKIATTVCTGTIINYPKQREFHPNTLLYFTGCYMPLLAVPEIGMPTCE